MPSVEYGRFGLQPTAVNHNRKKHLLSEPKKRKPRQEICALLKWLCFVTNFLVFVRLHTEVLFALFTSLFNQTLQLGNELVNLCPENLSLIPNLVRIIIVFVLRMFYAIMKK